MGHAVFGHRTKEHSRQLAFTVTPHDKQVCPFGRLEQMLRGVALLDDCLDPDTRVPFSNRVESILNHHLAVVPRVVLRRARRPSIGGRPLPRHQSFERGARQLGLGGRPLGGGDRRRGAIDTDHDPMRLLGRRRRRSLRVPTRPLSLSLTALCCAHDDDWAMGLMHAPAADGSENEAREAAATTRPHHEKICTFAFLDQDGCGRTVENPGRDRRSRCNGPRLLGRFVDILLSLPVHMRIGWGMALTRGGDNLKGRSRQPSLSCRPLHGTPGSLRAIDAHNDPVGLDGLRRVDSATPGLGGFAAHGRLGSFARRSMPTTPRLLGPRDPEGRDDGPDTSLGSQNARSRWSRPMSRCHRFAAPSTSHRACTSDRSVNALSTPGMTFRQDLLLSLRAHWGRSRTTSVGLLSSRSPRKRGCRSRASLVHSANPI